MKTLEEALGTFSNPDTIARHREIVASIGLSPQALGSLLSIASVPGPPEQKLMLAFAVGIVTGIEMEKP